MKKLWYIVFVIVLFNSCSKSFMNTPISKALKEEEIKQLPAFVFDKDTIIRGDEFYYEIREEVDDLFNKQQNQLSHNDEKAIELCEKITYKDIYSFFSEYWEMNMRDQIQLQEGSDKYEEYEVIQKSNFEKLKSKYPDVCSYMELQ